MFQGTTAVFSQSFVQGLGAGLLSCGQLCSNCVTGRKLKTKDKDGEIGVSVVCCVSLRCR